ncbi:lysophospholipid acyltransferase family protein [Jannaschia aquimarina]|uniref:PlsC protein n=1 Tax=Jannaschia aquimarina TaxID=935700 RepID=A0A0D1EQC3_9RHOB|nr:lysophospholipid acyltransferase family protein [Jannaschia aquimarina]KIT17805.1 1-acyl-sn-glycerol-3-phosphate acyltransferase [Jannaschia aquimarina]SNS91181.1 1-acyl-sn-glycerol-3-phosphate acyltransferase [Jannaschia aquimarina]
MQYARSLFFNVAMYAMFVLLGFLFAPWALFSRKGARTACSTIAKFILRIADPVIGLRCEVRGTPPEGQVLVAAKHQSFLDILMIWDALPRPFFIMKALLRFVPVWGRYAILLGCIPVHRGKRSEAIKRMLQEVRAGERAGGQLVIYPQGTRVAPGAHIPYKVGTFALYEQLGQPCVPVACNVGVFWPKRGLLRKPGTAVIEFLEPIPPGLDRATFMAVLEARIEGASNRLMAEAGFPVSELPQAMGDPIAAAAHETVH